MRGNDCIDREDRLAEERLLLATQVAIQKELNRRGLKYRDLASRLGVSEARISQLMGDDALNLTIRTVAKIFHRLGERAVVTTQREVDQSLKVNPEAAEATWEFSASSDIDFDVKDANQIELDELDMSPNTRDDWVEWAAAEADAMRRRVA